MIDAYEIGIQLLLQEDVSAGLDVINRGLADVDRAIAATSADLAELLREANTATKAVSAAVGRQTIQTAANEKDTSNAQEQVAQSRSEVVPPETQGLASGEKAAAPEVKTTDQSAPARPTTRPEEDADTRRILSLREQIGASSAPAKGATDEPLKSGHNAASRQPETNAAAGVTAMLAVPMVPHVSASVTPSIEQAAPARPESLCNLRPQAVQVALTASVNRELRSSTPGAQLNRAKEQPLVTLAAQAGNPRAPWFGTRQSGQDAKTSRLNERAAAPRSSGRATSEVGGGTVMLDGRLVGQWLSENMARDAARPPAGTSFFDPRQTPSWNVSGAL